MALDAESNHRSAALARPLPRMALTLVAVVASLTGGCGLSATPSGEDASPDRLARTAEVDTTAVTAPAVRRTTTTASPPIQLGRPGRPFSPLPPASEARAVVTGTGVVLRVIDERPTSWLVSTPCQNIRFVTDAEPIGRAHVVLDPGHGGVEVGATGATGLTESELNLRVATRAAELLRAAGATVVLTRTGDHAITAASRGHIARAVEPALFVSIHHNGGAPPVDERPGTIVFTKTGSPESTRFGGIFYEALQPMLEAAAEPKRAAYRAYAEALDAYEQQVAAYDRSVAARDQALVANGQVPPEATTTVPAITTTVGPGEVRVPVTRQAAVTTTVPASVASPVPVPETLAPPPPPQLEPVRQFRWAGAPNGGVRSWIRPDGADYLAVLRHSGRVPAVLAEFTYVTNPSEEELLADPAFVDAEAGVLADAVVRYFTTDAQGTGHVGDQLGDQPIGGSGGIDDCVEPPLD